MTDYRPILERARNAFAAPDMPIERVLRRRDRRRRNQRIAAGAVGIAIAIAIVVGSVVAAMIHSDLRPAEPTPTSSMGPTPSPVSPALLRRGGEIAFAGSNGLWAQDPQTGERRKLAGCSDPCVFIDTFAWSPDGAWIAYNVSTCLAALPCEPEAGLWVKGAVGEPRQLTSVCEADQCTAETWAWKPDGTAIADASVDAGGSRIILLDPASGGRTTVAEPEEVVTAVSWTPDGSGLLYASTDPQDGASTVFSIDPGTGNSVFLANLDGTTQSFAWAPDGSKVAFDEGGEDRSSIEVMNADGSDLHVIESGDPAEGPGAPSWSPDGTRIAYISTPRSKDGFRAQFWVVPVDLSAPAVSLFEGGCCIGDWAGAVWSPDGTQVAFMEDAQGYVWRTVRADGSGPATEIDESLYESWNQRP